jgi:hypothetical protein
MDLSHLRLEDLNEEVFAQASRTSQDAFALLDRIRDISQATKSASCEIYVLTFLARLALRPWVDGDLRVEIRSRSELVCEVKLLREIGGAYEVLKRIMLYASLRKFNELGMDIKRILPFMLVKVEQTQLAFEAKADMRRNTVPPPSFAKADQLTGVWKSIVQPNVPRDLAPTLLEDEAWRYSDEAPTLPIVRTALPERAAVTLPGMPKKPDPTPEASASDDIDDGWEDV